MGEKELLSSIRSATRASWHEQQCSLVLPRLVPILFYHMFCQGLLWTALLYRYNRVATFGGSFTILHIPSRVFYYFLIISFVNILAFLHNALQL